MGAFRKINATNANIFYPLNQAYVVILLKVGITEPNVSYIGYNMKYCSKSNIGGCVMVDVRVQSGLCTMGNLVTYSLNVGLYQVSAEKNISFSLKLFHAVMNLGFIIAT